MHPAAEKELTDAVRFYRREAGQAVAARFLSEVERVVTPLSRFTELGTPTGEFRRSYPLTGFPYSLIYRIDPDCFTLLVLRHQSRDPSHGQQRRLVDDD